MSIRKILVPFFSMVVSAASGVGCVEQVEPMGLRACSVDADCGGDKSCVSGLCVVNDPPTVDVGPDQVVRVGERVSLDGSATVDVNGDRLTYRWTQVGGAESVQFEDEADNAIATFTAPSRSGDLAFELVVSDGAAEAAKAADQVVVTVTNAAPKADGGAGVVAVVPDPAAPGADGPLDGGAAPALDVDDPGGIELFTLAEVDAGERIVLDGGASSDPEGLPLSYRWRQTGGDRVTLVGPATQWATFTAPAVKGDLSFELIVHDGEHASNPVQVEVIVLNQDPVAIVDGAGAVAPGSIVTLDASRSFDPDGDPVTFIWDQTGGPGVHLEPLLSGASVRFAAPVHRAELAFRVGVQDDDQGQGVAFVTVDVGNTPPMAVVTPEVVEAAAGELVRLEAGDSYDPDGDPLSYHWQQVQGPEVLLIGDDGPRPHFSAPAQRSTLAFALVVHDGVQASAPARALVTVANRRPLAQIAGPADRTVPPGAAISLDGAPSTDPDGDALTYAWRQVAGPAVALADTAAAVLTFESPADRAELAFELQVSDGIADSGVARVRVHVANQPPTADAGPDLTAAPERTVQLDGTRSGDPDGDAVTYAWKQLDGDPVVLSDATTGLPKLQTPARRQTLRFELIVSDGIAASAPDTVQVHVGNTPPIARAGPDQRVEGEARVTLDASASSDADGDALGYRWEQIEGEAVVLEASASESPRFTAPMRRGELTFRLTVTDGDAGHTDAVAVTVDNHAPVADAGPGQLAEAGAEVALDGTASSDPDGDGLTFDWVQSAGEAVELVDAHTATPRFTTLRRRAAYTFELTVHDGIDASAPDTVEISVGNLRPVAHAGEDVDGVIGGDGVRLDGRASADPDDDDLEFAWTQVAGPAVILDDAGDPRPRFTTPRPRSELRFELIVDDSIQASEPDSVTVRTANNDPLADAGPAQQVASGALVTLDATASADIDGDALSCAWSQLGGPPVRIETPGECVTGFVAPVERSATEFEVTVSDGLGGVAAASTVVSVANNRPIADAGQDLQVDPGQIVVLDGLPSTDLDGDELQFAWLQDGGEEVELRLADTPAPRFTAPPRRGRVTFVLVVSDGIADSEPDRIDVHVNNAPPVADAGDDQLVARAAAVALDAAGTSDPEGDALTYAWRQLDGPPVNLDGADSVQATFVAPDRRASMSFELVVNDGFVDSAPAVVQVRTPNSPPSSDAGLDRQIDGGEQVTLDASGSSDLDGDELTYEWEQAMGDGVRVNDPAAVRPTFTAPIPRQDLRFRVRAHDGLQSGEWDEVRLSVRNHAPDADAGADQAVRGGHSVRLDGQASADLDGDSLTFAWTSPAGVVLDDATIERPRFTAPVPRQSLRFQLRVTDELGAVSALDEVVVSVLNNAPRADGGPDRFTARENRVELDGGASTDLDGDALTYLWEQIGGPDVDIEAKNAGRVIAFETPDFATTLTFLLTATDPFGAQDTDQVRVAVGGNGNDELDD